MKSAVGIYTPSGMWWQQADLSLLRFASTSLLLDRMAADLDINVFVPQDGKHNPSEIIYRERPFLIFCVSLH